MKIKVSIPVEEHFHNETFTLAREVEVEIDDEQTKVIVQEVAAQLRVQWTGLTPSAKKEVEDIVMRALTTGSV